MGQPVLTATLAVAIAVIFTAAIAVVTSASETLSRVVNFLGVVALIAFAVVALQRANLRINFTGSMPIGIYSVSALPLDGVKRGMLVAACAPSRAAEIGRQRGYLGAGPCAGNTELLLKSVAAIAGDEVSVTPMGVTVNGCLLDHSRPAPRDRSARQLGGWLSGRYRLAAGQVWLYAADDRSWDSRYWGPAAATSVADNAYPVLVLPARLARRRACRTALTSGLPFSGNPETRHHLLSFDIILTDAVSSFAWNRSG
jgi:conjugative transfer signal peptidase TraF